MWWLRVDVSKRRFLKIEKGQILHSPGEKSQVDTSLTNVYDNVYLPNVLNHP